MWWVDLGWVGGWCAPPSGAELLKGALVSGLNSPFQCGHFEYTHVHVQRGRLRGGGGSDVETHASANGLGLAGPSAKCHSPRVQVRGSGGGGSSSSHNRPMWGSKLAEQNSVVFGTSTSQTTAPAASHKMGPAGHLHPSYLHKRADVANKDALSLMGAGR